MSRIIDHEFQVGQRWQNENYILYIMAVDDDEYDEYNRPLKPGGIAVTEDKPFPDRKFNASVLHPNNMKEVILRGNYKLMDVGWDVEFIQQKEAIRAAKEAAGVKEPDPIRPPPLSGLGAMLS